MTSKASMKEIRRFFRGGKLQKNYYFWSEMIETSLPQCTVMLNEIKSAIEDGRLKTDKTPKQVFSEILEDYGRVVYPHIACQSVFSKKHRTIEMGVLVDITLSATTKLKNVEERQMVYNMLPQSAQTLMRDAGIDQQILSGDFRAEEGV